MVLDGVSNDNEIARNLNHHQSISRKTYPEGFFYFEDFSIFISKFIVKIIKKNYCQVIPTWGVSLGQVESHFFI
jgi:hypothetical protein